MVGVKIIERKPAGVLFAKEKWILSVNGRKISVDGRVFDTFMRTLKSGTKISGKNEIAVDVLLNKKVA